MLALLLGAFLGFISAVPVAGPVSALVLSYGLRGHFTAGRWLSLGAGLVEGLYVFLAFWGWSTFLSRYPDVLRVSSWLTVVLLAGIGIYFIQSKKMRVIPEGSQKPKAASAWAAFSIGSGVAIANPSVLVTWMAGLTALHSMRLLDPGLLHGALFSLGVGFGIFGWFYVFLKVLKKYRARFEVKVLDWVLKGIGFALIAIAVGLLWRGRY